MKKYYLLFLCLSLAACAPSYALNYIAPSEVPFTMRMMKTPGFWIARHPSPDTAVINLEQVQQFNQLLDYILHTKDEGHLRRALSVHLARVNRFYDEFLSTSPHVIEDSKGAS